MTSCRKLAYYFHFFIIQAVISIACRNSQFDSSSDFQNRAFIRIREKIWIVSSYKCLSKLQFTWKLWKINLFNTHQKCRNNTSFTYKIYNKYLFHLLLQFPLRYDFSRKLFAHTLSTTLSFVTRTTIGITNSVWHSLW